MCVVRPNIRVSDLRDEARVTEIDKGSESRSGHARHWLNIRASDLRDDAKVPEIDKGPVGPVNKGKCITKLNRDPLG
jgi:hypothetical protein